MAQPKKTTPQRWQSANLLDLRPNSRRLWHFGIEKQKPVLQSETPVAETGLLSNSSVGKDWRAAIQPRLNVAWLPLGRVYLRLLHLPSNETAELQSMIELQLEKLSPIPVSQVVWSYQILPGSANNLTTIAVTIVPRNTVDEFLGQLEKRGYIADRIEVPLIDQLMGLEPREDSAWLIPAENNTFLVAWWTGGTWQQLALLTSLSPEDRAAQLTAQLGQVQWAGELEGWLTTEPKWNLVGTPETIAEWEPVLQAVIGGPVDVQPPLAPAELARRNADRALKSATVEGLVPADKALAYKQQLTNRLWIGALGAAVGVYCIGAALYMGWLGIMKFQQGRIETEVASVRPGYTNTIQMRQRVLILEEQSTLKFAALDSWKTTAELLPPEMQIVSMTLSRGKKMALFGTVPQSDSSKISDFNEALSKAVVNGKPVAVTPPIQQAPRPSASGIPTISWSFDAIFGGKDE